MFKYKNIISLLLVIGILFNMLTMESHGKDTTDWNIETVDEHVGYIASIAVDTKGFPSIAYFGPGWELRYARWTGEQWNITTIDTVGCYSYGISLKLDGDDNPHIAYSDISRSWKSVNYTTEFYTYSCTLKYAEFIGNSWKIEKVDSINKSGYTYTGGPSVDLLISISLAMDGDNAPHIAYRWINGTLKYAKQSEKSWEIEPIGTYGEPVSIEMYNGNPCIVYQSGYVLKCAKVIERNWTTEIIYRWDASNTSNISIMVDGDEFFSYLLFTGFAKPLECARWTGNSWEIDIVAPKTYGASQMELDRKNYPHIAYIDHKGLKYAKFTGDCWETETVELTERNLFSPQLAVDNKGGAHIAYFDSFGHLRYAKERTFESEEVSTYTLWPLTALAILITLIFCIVTCIYFHKKWNKHSDGGNSNG